MKNTIAFLVMLVVSTNLALSQGFLKKLKTEIQKEEAIQKKRDSTAKATNVQANWVRINSGNQMPNNAMVGGRDQDGTALFVAHGNYMGNWHPGKTRKDWNSANIENGGKEEIASAYEVMLDGGNFTWSPVSGIQLPSNLVIGGAEGNRTFYICRCQYQNSTQVGKTWAGWPNCNIGFGGNGYDIGNYEILVQNGAGNYSTPMQGTNQSSYNNYQQAAPAAIAVASQPMQNMNQPVPQNHNPTLGAYGNYDFVPGETVLFEDNFASEQVGEFPSRWDLEKGQAEANKFDGKMVFLCTEGTVYVAPRLTTKSYLTDPFTVEFDYFNQRFSNNVNGDNIILQLKNNPQDKQLTFTSFGSVESSYFDRNFSNPYPDMTKRDENFKGYWHHAAVIFKNGQIKVYIDEHRVLVMPNTGIQPYALEFLVEGSLQNPGIFTNVKIAAGGSMNMVGKKFTDAKIVTHGIKFDVDQATMRPESMGTLNMIKQLMMDNPDVRFEIGGHTDNDGAAPTNLKLSQDRADAVKSALVDLGIDASRLTTKGYGSSKPISDNNGDDGKANNRRVEFVRF